MAVVSKLRQIALSTFTSFGETTMSQQAYSIPYAEGIELKTSKRALQLAYDRGGLYSDRSYVSDSGSTDTRDLMMDTTLTFKTPLYGYKDAAAALSTSTNALIALAKHSLFGAFAPSSRQPGTASAVASANVTMSVDVSSDIPAGSCFVIDPTSNEFTNRLRWVRTTDGADNVVNRVITTGTTPNAYAATTVFAYDTAPASFLGFEVCGATPEDVFFCNGCIAESMKIVLSANQFPMMEFTFKVGHFHRLAYAAAGSGSLFTGGFYVPEFGQTNNEAKGDRPYPMTYLESYINGQNRDLAEFTVEVKNELSAAVGTTGPYGFQTSPTRPWTLTGRSIDVSFKRYSPTNGSNDNIDTDFIDLFEAQTGHEIDIHWPGISTSIGSVGFVAMLVPNFRIKEYPTRSDIDGQLAYEVKGTADYAKGDVFNLTSTSQRSSSATAPADSEFRIAWT